MEGRDGGGAVLRLIHSGIQGEDWEAEYHSHGWDGFLQNLRRYFDHFRGLPGHNVSIIAFSNLDKDGIWERFDRALDIRRPVAVGDAVRLTPAGPAPIDGVAEVVQDGLLGIRSDRGFHLFSGDGAWGMVNIHQQLYGHDIDDDEIRDAWQQWADEQFPPSEFTPPEGMAMP